MIRAGIIATLAAVIMMAGIILWTWSNLPETGEIPIHYNGAGKADGWASGRNEAIRFFFLMPGAALVISGFLAFALKANLGGDGLTQSAAALMATWFGLLALLTFICFVVGFKMVGDAAAADDGEDPFALLRWAGVGVGALHIVVGNYLPKSRPNAVFGIRTPWTLSSPNTWEKTHRFGGPAFMLTGIASIVGAFVFDGVWIFLSGGVAVVIAGAICVVYSFLAWRKAGDRNAKPNYLP